MSASGAAAGLHVDVALCKHRGPVNAVLWNSTGDYCMTGGSDGDIHLWNPHTARLIKTYPAHGHSVLSLALTRDSSTLASSGDDTQPCIWDIATGTQTRRLRGHLSRVNSVAFSGNDAVLVSGSYDTTVRVWDVRARSAAPVQTLADARDAVACVAVAGPAIYAAAVDGCVRCYDARRGTAATDTLGVPAAALALAHDGRCYAVATLDSRVRLVDRASGRVLATYAGAAAARYAVQCAFAPDDAAVVAGSEDGALLAWDIVSTRVLCRARPPPPVASVSTSSSSALASASSSAAPSPLCAVSVHPARLEVLTGSHDGTVRLWRTTHDDSPE